jgi:hypothetical protein
MIRFIESEKKTIYKRQFLIQFSSESYQVELGGENRIASYETDNKHLKKPVEIAFFFVSLN